MNGNTCQTCIQTKQKENRKKYPEVAKLVDEVRKYFPGARSSA